MSPFILFGILLGGACGGEAPSSMPPPVEPPVVLTPIVLPPQTPPDARLTLRTWNLEQFPKDDRAPEEVAQILTAATHPVGVVGLQEIREPEVFWDLAQALPNHEGLLAQSGYFTGVGLLYNRDQLRLLSDRSLFTEDSYAFPRPVLMATFEVIATQTRLHVLVLHLKARLDEESETRRRAAIDRLHDWLQAQALLGEPLVVMGDFNDKLTDPAQDNVFIPMIEDPRYSLLTMPLARAGAFSYPTYRAMIDHIVVSAATLEQLPELGTEVLRLDQEWPQYQDLISDHLPVDTHLLLH